MQYRFRLLFFVISSPYLMLPAAAQTKETKPAAPPPWMTVAVEHRTRYETLDNRFRLGEVGSDQQLPQRTRLRFELKEVIAPFGFGFEFEDARVHLDDSGSTVTNTMEDENDITRLYLSFSKPLGKSKLPSHVYIGRQSFDLGSRRLFARNRFRNTTNSFDAVRWTLGNEKQWLLTTFLSRPVVRRMHQPDKSDYTAGFWGAFLAAAFTPEFKNEVYYFGLRESVNSPRSTRRRYSTFGTRLYKDPAPGKMSYELEAAIQFGKRAALRHLAHFEHISADYTFNTRWTPMLTGRYDYGSGSEDPATESGTFDTLFGARRWEYGPTGIYGAFTRSNINTPGMALQLNPTKKLRLFQYMRWIWLAQARDQWVGTRLQDRSGQAGTYVGSQLEFTLAYNPTKYFQPEVGYVRLFKGSYLERVPRSPGFEDSNYFYVQASFIFDQLLVGR